MDTGLIVAGIIVILVIGFIVTRKKDKAIHKFMNDERTPADCCGDSCASESVTMKAETTIELKNEDSSKVEEPTDEDKDVSELSPEDEEVQDESEEEGLTPEEKEQVKESITEAIKESQEDKEEEVVDIDQPRIAKEVARLIDVDDKKAFADSLVEKGFKLWGENDEAPFSFDKNEKNKVHRKDGLILYVAESGNVFIVTDPDA